MLRSVTRTGIALVVVCPSLLATACVVERGVRDETDAPSPQVTAAAPAPPAPATNRASGKVVNLALGPSEGLVQRAISDLKAVGYWDDLTRHLAGVRISSRLGRVNVPTDRHLADAMLSVRVDGTRRGGECDIMLFPTAMRDDLGRYHDYIARGVLDGPAPTFRQFSASILGHELAHCLAHGRLTGEQVARGWERKVLKATQAQGTTSQT